MKLIDFSLPIRTGMGVYPNDPAVRIQDASEEKKGKCHISLLTMGSHTGTHIDMPYHFVEDGAKISSFPLEECVSPGVVLRRSAQPEEVIVLTREECETVPAGGAVLLDTGWQKRRGTADYFTRVPTLHPDSVQALLERGAALFGFDTPSVDNSSTNCGIHRLILGSGKAIVEGLYHLEQLPESGFLFVAAPLLIADEEGGDGSPVRAFAQIL